MAQFVDNPNAKAINVVERTPIDFAEMNGQKEIVKFLKSHVKMAPQSENNSIAQDFDCPLCPEKTKSSDQMWTHLRNMHVKKTSTLT